MGKMYIDVHGNTEIKNLTSGEKVEFTFYRRGWRGSNAYRVEAEVKDKEGNSKFKMKGHWNDKLFLTNCATGKEEKIWEMNPLPANCERQYHFTKFAINLNYINDKIKQAIPPTDSRLRPDQRLMEEGKMDVAAQEKHRLEEKQRAARRLREEMGQEFKPLWWEESEENGEKAWLFNGKYFKQREKGDWSMCPDLF